ncbi:MAG: L-rhamnose mutarotase [Sphingomonas taxi]
MPRRVVKLLDLVDDADLIAEYERCHAPGAVWPEVTAHIRATGVLGMEIWRFVDRMVMIAEVADDFPRDLPAPAVEGEWEALMDRFQRRIPGTPKGTKWAEADRIFTLD